MGAISALSTVGRTLKRNTVLFPAAFVVTLVSLVPTGVVSLLPPSSSGLLALPMSALTFLLVPFLLGGMLTMADEGIDGDARFGSFVDGGTTYYLRILGTMVLFAILSTVVLLVTVLVIGAVGALVLGMNATGADGSLALQGASVGILVLLGLFGFLATIVPTFFLQFYAPAIVVSDLGVVASLKRSAGLVRRNLVSTLGYTTISYLVSFATSITIVLAMMVAGVGLAGTDGGSTSAGLAVLVGGGLLTAVVTTVITAFGVTYQVAFYDDCLASLD